MVPCEFRCWGQYLPWQFTIGLCATLARSRNERPDTFACFLWPAQYRMGRAYSLQNSTGEWWLVVSPWEDSGFVSKEKQKDACKELGFSLLEVLIAMAISSVLLLGQHAFCLRYSVKV